MAAALLVVVLLTGCSAIDDDLSDCPPDASNYELNYELTLVTNMTTELQTQLNTIAETSIATKLTEHLKDIFSDYARDVDLSFYDTEGDLRRLSHEQQTMNANQRSYTLTLPMRQYLHLAVANLQGNGQVSLTGDDVSSTSVLRQKDSNVIASHATGLFTARLPMRVLEGVSQTFNVKLYMANCAAALVIDPRGHDYTSIKVLSTGFASQFNISDSTYVFPSQPFHVEAQQLENGDDPLLGFCSVHFPSPEPTRAEGDETLWQFKVYLTKSDGTITETVLNIAEPLRAGQLKIVKGYLDDDGAVRTRDQRVGISVTLNWNDGGEHDFIL